MILEVPGLGRCLGECLDNWRDDICKLVMMMMIDGDGWMLLPCHPSPDYGYVCVCVLEVRGHGGRRGWVSCVPFGSFDSVGRSLALSSSVLIVRFGLVVPCLWWSCQVFGVPSFGEDCQHRCCVFVWGVGRLVFWLLHVDRLAVLVVMMVMMMPTDRR